ncbi:MAG TPA: hypothetical protein VJ648_12745 [Vicinamibacteria bacterium]|nr:hypothetical protein [Vicinamibacteria bacterium]
MPSRACRAYTRPRGRLAIPDPPRDETFDSEFLSELEGLVTDSGIKVSEVAQAGDAARGYRETLAAFLAAPSPGGSPLNEAGFLELPPPALGERCNGLVESCRRSPRRDAAQAAESFVVFFQALVPTLSPEPAREVKATFFRLVPTLVQMAWEDSAEGIESRRESREALALLETILLEVSSVRLAPVESGQLFKALDQLAMLIAAGEWTLARDVVAAPLLQILRKNRVARSLFRLMEVEMGLQGYLRERLGHDTPHIRVPDDLAGLSDFGPLRVFEEDGPEGARQVFLQVQLPDIPILSDIVVHLSGGDGRDFRLRLDGLGSVPLELPAGLYQIGLLYEPEASRA